MSRDPIDVITGLRNTRRSMGDGTMRGRVRNATPVRRRGSADRLPTSKVVSPSATRDAGRHVTVSVPAQTWDGTLTFAQDAVRDAGWSGSAPLTGNADEFVVPAQGYYDLHLDLDCDEVDDVTLWVEVDGTTRTPTTTLDVHGTIMWDFPLGVLAKGAVVTVHTDTALSVSDGIAVLQSVDRQVAETQEPAPEFPDTANARVGSGTIAIPDYQGRSPEEGDRIVAVIYRMGGTDASLVDGSLVLDGGSADTTGDETTRCHSSLWEKVADSSDISAGTVEVDITAGGTTVDSRTVVLNLGPGTLTDVAGTTEATDESVSVSATLSAPSRAMAVTAGVAELSGSYWDTPWAQFGVTDSGWDEVAGQAGLEAHAWRVQTSESSGGSANMTAEADGGTRGGAGFFVFGVA